MANVVVNIVTSLPTATSTTPIVFTVTGASGVGLRLAWVSLTFPGILGDEVVHNGARFGVFYTNGLNTRTAITNGFQFQVLRDGGWPTGAFPLTGSFTISAVDTLGNGTP